LVVAKIAPIKLNIKERRKIYQKGSGFKKEERCRKNLQWQQEWETYEGHAKICIKNVDQWCQTPWTDTDHFLTQFLTGHGAFGQYLCRIGKRENPFCRYCKTTKIDTAIHTLLECPRWITLRQQAAKTLGKDLQESNLSELLLPSKKH